MVRQTLQVQVTPNALKTSERQEKSQREEQQKFFKKAIEKGFVGSRVKPTMSWRNLLKNVFHWNLTDMTL